ncbi:MAG: DUF484 family protein [Alphaproteobacteria bacterium]|nr:DUF484 family protein [Alphaproteobacteria bacterium]
MSDVVTVMSEKNETLSADDIVAYLRNNPDFLQNNPQALDLLLPARARPRPGEVADFQRYMIERLKADKEDVLQSSRTIVETSRANMNNQQRIHNAVLRLLESRNFDDFIHSITMDLANLLDVDIAVLVVEADGRDIPHVHTSGIRIIPEGTVDKWMRGKNVLLQDNIAGIEPIYGGGAMLVKSQILLRVDISAPATPPAILAFGSRDPNMFAEGQATDQILFLARVIERCFQTWLNLPG